MAKFKIMFFTMNQSGHMNPIWPVLKELIETGDFEVIIFVDENNRKRVESIGAKFRPVINNFEPFDNLNKGSTKPSRMYNFLRAFLEITKDNLEYMAKEIQKEEPDLIIYDFLCKHVKWVIRYYQTYYEMGRKIAESKAAKMKFWPKRELPPVIIFSPSFGMSEGVFPTQYELSVQKRGPNLWEKIKIFFIQWRFCFKFGLKTVSLKDNLPFTQPDFVKKVLVCIVPEVQPKAHLFDQKKFRFVGSTVNETFVDARVNEEIFKNLLKKSSGLCLEKSLILPRNDEFKLIFASLGTVFNNSVDLYKCIIDAFKIFDEEPEESRHELLRLKHLRIVVSLGDKVSKEIEIQIRTGEYQVPENIVLVKSAPQIDLLKRSCLFITHGGMNSASESIHFGVPMIVIPIAADQPLVANRIANDLGLAIRFDKTTVNPKDIRAAAHQIFSDRSFYIRAKRFSDISHSYDGVSNMKNEIIKMIKCN